MGAATGLVRCQIGLQGLVPEAAESAEEVNLPRINTQIDVAEDVPDAFVDSAQIASAVANILTNAVQSYAGQLGPIKISAEPTPSRDMVKLQVMDLGRGMDSETLRKATQPFFCRQPAGRKRGMGLAYAARFVQINAGTLDIQSQPGDGTTVTISLPTE